jgi:hypothetical protein
MKLQDLLFFILLGILIGYRRPVYLVLAGLCCIILAIPLFHFWVFFTAQRLVMYAAGFFLAAIIIFWFQKQR